MSTFGKLFAVATDDEQAEFLNEAGKMLRQTTESNLYAEIQMSRVADKLNTDGKKLINMLARMIAP